MPRYEYVEGTSAKFWEIEIDGSSVITRWGRLGTAGQEKTKAFASPDKAQAEYDGLIREKVGKGYKPAGEATSAPSPRPAAAPPPSPVKEEIEAPPSPPPPPAAEPGGDYAIAWTDALRRKLHPRRSSGVRTVPLAPEAAFARMRAHWDLHAGHWAKANQERWEASLVPALEAVRERLGGSGGEVPRPASPEVEAATFAALSHSDRVRFRQAGDVRDDVIDFWAGTRGLAGAVEALVTSLHFGTMIEPSFERAWLVRSAGPSGPPWGFQLRDFPKGILNGWLRLRKLLASASEPEWEAARERGERLRQELPAERRAAISYLFPDVAGWVEEDAEEALGQFRFPGWASCLATCVSDAALLGRMAGDEPHRLIVTVGWDWDVAGLALSLIEGVGTAAVPVLVRLLDPRFSTEHRRELAEALAIVPCEEAAAALAERLEDRAVTGAAQLFAANFPRLALPAFAAQAGRGRGGQAAASLLAAIASREREVAIELLPSLPATARHGVEAALAKTEPPRREAGTEELPSVLAAPAQPLPARRKVPAFWQPASFTRPRLRGREAALPLGAVEHLGTMLAFSRPAELYAGIAQVKEACDPESLADFAWDLFNAWQNAGFPAKEGWAFQALGFLGGDECARRLSALIRQWPGEGGHARAVTGLDVLRAIGTDVALMHLHGIAQKVKFKGLQEKAREKIAEVAEQRGLTPEELADRLVPDLGLGPDGSMTLDYGPRAFRVGFDEHLKPFVRDPAGKRLSDLPKPGKADDPELAVRAQEAWKALKKDAKTIASQQILRLERAMCDRRRWPEEVFRTFLAGHPLVQHLARRLVWGIWDDEGKLAGTFRISEDGSFADADDEAWELPVGAPPGALGLVHALDLTDGVSARWGQVLGDYEIVQPFRQIGREVYAVSWAEKEALELRRFAGMKVPAGKILGLVARGWLRGDPQDAGIVCWVDRPLPGTGHVARLEFLPGFPVMDLTDFEEQEIHSLTLEEPGVWTEGGALPFGALEPVLFSELVRELEMLRA